MFNISLKSLKGIGKFCCNLTKFEIDFELFQLPNRTYFLINVSDHNHHHQLDKAFSSDEHWELDGQLNDGRHIVGKEIYLMNLTNKDAEFTSLGPLFLGNLYDSPIIEARFPLVGFFSPQADLNYKGWEIEISGDLSQGKRTKRLSTDFQIPMEGLTLKISSIKASKEEYIELARHIMLLLSLAAGNGVTCYRQLYSCEKGNDNLEVLRKMVGDEFGPGPRIPELLLKDFLRSALPIFLSWPKQQQEAFRLAVIYINISHSGYLDSRLVSIMQAWEFISLEWKNPVSIGKSEIDLKSNLKSTYSEWKKRFPNSDKNGFLGSRLNSIFDWPRLKKQIKSLVKSRGLDIDKIGLDLDNLKKARDGVAHTGKMPNEMHFSKDQTVKILASAQFGLQLLLLIELGYIGKVNAEKGGWKSIQNVEDFLLPKT